MKIALCITCKNRVDHIKETLPKNLADNPGADVVFVLLDYNDDGDLKEYVKNSLSCMDAMQSGKLVCYQYRQNVPFHMAHAKNMAHRCGILEGADVLVNLDADNFTGEGFADYIREVFERTNDDPQEIFLWSRMRKDRMARGISGRICVTKNAFLVAAGYDERFNTHSPDDKDFNARLRGLGYCAQEIDARFLLALNHNDKIRFKEYPELHGAQSYHYDSYRACQTSRVVNDGRIGCGVVYRNFCETPIELKPLPTRIFGIGLHKTATTSLHQALQLLGFKSGHWESAHWAKALWLDILNLGRSPAVDKFYALSDLPIPLIYQQLDRAYPGSKFILTVRPPEDWLRSVESHFSSLNKFKKQWNRDPFTHRIHRELYGRKTFDREIFLARYLRHNAEVLEYFKDRPDDLLVMNMDGNCRWRGLCAFLGAPVPAEPYPKKYVTGT